MPSTLRKQAIVIDKPFLNPVGQVLRSILRA